MTPEQMRRAEQLVREGGSLIISPYDGWGSYDEPADDGRARENYRRNYESIFGKREATGLLLPKAEPEFTMPDLPLLSTANYPKITEPWPERQAERVTIEFKGTLKNYGHGVYIDKNGEMQDFYYPNPSPHGVLTEKEQ